eukprot:9852647-Karenia_brevis.AAC.1
MCIRDREKDDKEVVILGRVVRWLIDGIECEAEPKHRKIILEYVEFDSSTKPSVVHGDKKTKQENGRRSSWVKQKLRSIGV